MAIRLEMRSIHVRVLRSRLLRLGGSQPGLRRLLLDLGLRCRSRPRRCFAVLGTLDHVLLYELSPVVEFDAEQYGAGLFLSVVDHRDAGGG